VETLMPHAIQIRQTGGPEVLNRTPIEVGEPGLSQVRLRQVATDLNYINVYHRTGYYSQPVRAHARHGSSHRAFLRHAYAA
jgi:NADPH:quinone reductase-like Zn-dependent oxidoreductase